MKRSLILIAGIAFGLLFTSARPGVSQITDTSMKLKVKVSYTGAGKVDDGHRIYVVLWDTPTFTSGDSNPPAEIRAADWKDGVAIFENVKTVPAYISTVYDPKGEWDGKSSAPPEGASLGLYSKTPGTPEPINIKAGQTTSIEFSFDDSIKMQGGH